MPRPPTLARALVGMALLSMLAAPVWGSQGLSPEETRMVEAVREDVGEALGLLKEIVEINSGTLNVAGVREVGEVLRPYFEELGFAVRWEEMPESMGRAGHLCAEREGSRGPRILLIGHLDTVFEPDHEFQTFRVEGKSARGPGVNDMKGGDVAILFALRALQRVSALDDSTLRVVFTGDEERVGRPLEVARAGLVEVARQSDVALGFETGSMDPDGTQFATVARRSSSGWHLEVRGRQAHSSGIFGEESGSGAIFEASRILDAFHEELRGERYLTFNAGVILGGTEVAFDEATSGGEASGKSNVIPSHVVVHGGIRTLTDEQLASARNRMTEIVSRHLPVTEATITFTDGYPSMPPTDANLGLLELLNEVNADLGAPRMEAYDPGRRGAADISFVAPYVPANLAALGVFGRHAHSPEEDLDLDLFPLVIERTALLIYRLLEQGAP